MFEVLPVVLAVFASLPGATEGAAFNRSRPALVRAPHELLTALDRPVRAPDRSVQQLLARGMARSPTFVALMRALDRTDVIVYVELSAKLPMNVAGRLLFATAGSGGHRYLRIQIARDSSTNAQVAAIAHELQHAIEVAQAPDVRDEAGLARLYGRIGTRGALADSYDTEAAQLTGRRVLFEIQG